MLNLKTLIGAGLLAVIAGSAMADDHAVRMGTEGAYPPYNFINDKGELDGFEIEYGNMLCEMAKLECTWVKNDWDSIIPNLVSSNYDVIIAGMSITAERDRGDLVHPRLHPGDLALVLCQTLRAPKPRPDLARYRDRGAGEHDPGRPRGRLGRDRGRVRDPGRDGRCRACRRGRRRASPTRTI